VLRTLGVSRAAYYRYRRAVDPKPRKPRAKGPPPTPSERLAVREIALSNPTAGYKRLAWMLQNDEIAGLRAHTVLALLREQDLIVRRSAAGPSTLTRPAEPDRPNQVWHIDLMYVWLRYRWWYLVDVLDGYSRFLVHWTLNDTMETDTVTLTVLEALERWAPETEPAVVHDHGSQFISNDWRKFIEHHGLASIPTRVAHPESNGRIERLHRTHRGEALLGSRDWTAERARDELTRWAHRYNHLRPHGALHGLPPIVYYLGEPDAALAQREHFVQAAAETRTNYWRLREQEAVSAF